MGAAGSVGTRQVTTVLTARDRLQRPWPRVAAAGVSVEGGRDRCDSDGALQLSAAKTSFLEVKVAGAWPGAWEGWGQM